MTAYSEDEIREFVMKYPKGCEQEKLAFLDTMFPKDVKVTLTRDDCLLIIALLGPRTRNEIQQLLDTNSIERIPKEKNQGLAYRNALVYDKLCNAIGFQV